MFFLTGRQYEWADGSVVDYAVFGSDPVGGQCVAMVVSGTPTSPNVQWNAKDCSEEKGYVCGSTKGKYRQIQNSPAPKEGAHPFWGGDEWLAISV